MTTPDRTLIMTGATRGIGHEAAKEILRRSPDTSRDPRTAHMVDDVLGGLREISPHVSAVDIDL